MQFVCFLVLKSEVDSNSSLIFGKFGVFRKTFLNSLTNSIQFYLFNRTVSCFLWISSISIILFLFRLSFGWISWFPVFVCSFSSSISIHPSVFLFRYFPQFSGCCRVSNSNSSLSSSSRSYRIFSHRNFLKLYLDL